MGLDYSTAEFLLACAKEEPLGLMLILDHQNVYMTRREAGQIYSWVKVRLQPQGFADDFFRAISGPEVVFLDRTRHEGAEFVHDLNQPTSNQPEADV
ncbi:MAG: hypothetical protein JO207_08570 [Verrucomicrobia bacterium]|nr:hypothetical protein [Verrucomicrobiota bacterium]